MEICHSNAETSASARASAHAYSIFQFHFKVCKAAIALTRSLYASSEGTSNTAHAGETLPAQNHCADDGGRAEWEQWRGIPILSHEGELHVPVRKESEDVISDEEEVETLGREPYHLKQEDTT